MADWLSSLAGCPATKTSERRIDPAPRAIAWGTLDPFHIVAPALKKLLRTAVEAEG
jgi:hypothetical protein